MKSFTHDEVVEKLKRIQGKLSLRSFADKLHVSAAYLSDVYLRRRSPGKKILRHLGLEAVRTREVLFVQIRGKT